MSGGKQRLDLARRCAATMYAADAASQALGIRVEIPAPGQARASMTVRNDMVNGFAICHGGLLFTLADTAFAFACNTHGMVAVAAAATIDFLRPARTGDRLIADATERHRGGRQGVYDVTVRNQDGETLAVFRGRSAQTSKPIHSSDA